MGNSASNLDFEDTLADLLAKRNPYIKQCHVKIEFKVFDYMIELVKPLTATVELDTTANTADKLAGVRAAYFSGLKAVQRELRPHMSLSRMIVSVTGDVMLDSMYTPSVIAAMLRQAVDVLALSLPAEMVRPAYIVIEDFHPATIEEANIFDVGTKLFLLREKTLAKEEHRSVVGATFAIRRRIGTVEPRIATEKKILETAKNLGEEPI